MHGIVRVHQYARLIMLITLIGVLSIGLGARSLRAQTTLPGSSTPATPTPAPVRTSTSKPTIISSPGTGTIGSETPNANVTNVVQIVSEESAYLGAVTTATADGAAVQQVIAGSPAAQAGLQAGDVIQSVDNQLVTLQMPLSALLMPHIPGDLVLFVIVRNGATNTLPVTLGSRPANLATETPYVPGSDGTSAGGYLGIGLAALNPGFEIVKVDPASGAAQAGIQVGDLVVAMDGTPLTSTAQARALIGVHAPGTTMTIALQRGNQTLTIKAQVGGESTTSTAATPSPAPSSVTAMPTGTVNGTPTPTAAGSPALPAPSSTPGGVRLGVTYDVLTSGLATARSLSVINGALITSVTPGSPADIAGIKVGDVITAVNDQAVDVDHPLSSRISTFHDGDTFTLTVARTDQTLKISVTLAVSGSA